MTQEEIKNKLIKLGLCHSGKDLINYCKLVEKNRNTIAKNSTYDEHHILPKFYFKNRGEEIDDSKDNKVVLKIRDHFLAHWYLVRCGIGSFANKNVSALKMILGRMSTDQEIRRILNMSEIEIKKYALKIEKLKKRATHDEKARKIIGEKSSEAVSGTHYLTNGIDERRTKDPERLEQLLSNGYHYGRLPGRGPKSTEEGKNKFIKNRKGAICVTDGLHNKYVRPEEVEDYISKGWKKGGSKRKRVQRFSKPHILNGEIMMFKCDEFLKVKKEDVQSYLDQGYKMGRKDSTCAVNNGVHTIRIRSDELDVYLRNGWVKGKLKQPKKIKHGIPKKGTTIHVRKDGVCKTIKKTEWEKYELDGWIRGWPSFQTPEGIQRRVSKRKGTHVSEKSKEKIRRNAKSNPDYGCRGMIMVNNGQINKYIKPKDLQSYLDDGWIKGRHLSSATLEKTKGTSHNKGKISIRKGNESKFIFKDELEQYLSEGWERGEKKGNRIWVHKNNEPVMIDKDYLELYLEDGWTIGMYDDDNHPSSPSKGKICVNKDGKNKYVKTEELDKYLSEGWIKGGTPLCKK